MNSMQQQEGRNSGQVDLDEVQRLYERATGKASDVMASARIVLLAPRMAAELRAAREVVEALREWKDGPLLETYDPEFDYAGFAVDCLDAYDQAVGGGSS
jgi:hypothetical protein